MLINGGGRDDGGNVGVDDDDGVDGGNKGASDVDEDGNGVGGGTSSDVDGPRKDGVVLIFLFLKVLRTMCCPTGV